MTANNDDELKRLMALGLDGDKAAYKAVLSAVAAHVRRYMARRLDHGPLANDVEDLVQIVLIALHEKRATYDQTRQVMPWVYGIARYKLLEHLRASRRRLKDIGYDDIDAVLDIVEAPATDPTAKHDVGKMLDSLPDGTREAIMLTKIEGRSTQEVATRTGLTTTAVKVRVHRAMKTLQRMAKED